LFEEFRMSARTVLYRGIGFMTAACLSAALAACASSSDEPSNRNPVAAAFRCGESDIEARFMSRRMALFIDGRAYSLQQAEAASGARYTGSDGPRKIEFWNKGDEATLSFGERVYPTCAQTGTPAG